ncbi:family 78 glycoside hydrolase catalytic domain [Opitutus sp. ER46]|uniref:alpha-L-rhamnosidase-related protein n=1 Tax=Opitutus sp. ER46 TaxID=2161864 RepID=UPI000D309333|nr:family 78 glycoside hydrolase catalytic domain [Opitutus sp. ER46]PTX94476.1 hypothetical protein DB354_12080 [Opitutus sp. ER46]
MLPLPFVQRASWIWSAEGTHAVAGAAGSPSHYQVRLFRRRFEVAERPAQALVHVTADSRYLFFCNGERVGRGPAKGDVQHHFYETYDLAPHLVAGANVLAALVLDMSRVAHRPTGLGAPCSVMTDAGGFLLEGEVPGGERLDTGLPGWKVRADRAYRFHNDGTRFEGYHGYFEHRTAAEWSPTWMQVQEDDRAWAEATVLYRAERREERRDPTSPYGLVPRMIPPLEEGAPQRFAAVFAPGGAAAPAGWAELLGEGAALRVPPQSKRQVILDVGAMTTAYPRLTVAGGRGAEIRLTYAEALRLPWSTPGATLFGRQQSLANLASHFADESTGWTHDRRGLISGWSDRWEPTGVAETWEPLHWRAFRFVGVEITTGTEPLELRELGHRFTAYPVTAQGSFACSDPRLEAIWRTGLHTMRLCAHETFEDCPHYEQMQYAGDTMITSKLVMLTGGDYALTRQALHHFDWSRLPEGLTQSRYPSRLTQVIPSWSLHWITAVRDYAYCAGDLDTVRTLLPGMQAVLDWFRRHGDADGLPARLPFWNITDWCADWPRGVVPGADTGATCIIGAQFIVALDEVADLCRWLGERGLHRRLKREADRLRLALHRRFWSETEGLYFDQSEHTTLSQYGNAWAVLCGAAGEQQRARMMERFPQDPRLARGSFFCWHAVFRALRLAGKYDRMPEFLGPWHETVGYGLDTFVEENSYWRSLCHAWSAHPALEFITGVLGVSPLAPGFAEIEVAPHGCGLSHAAGTVCTPRGPVRVQWRREAGRFGLRIEAPKDTRVRVVLPNGARRQFRRGHFAQEVELP